MIYQGKTRTELVTSGSKYYRGYDPLTGKELWRLRDDTQVKVPSPVIAHDLFYLSRRQSARPRVLRRAANGHGDISPPRERRSRRGSGVAQGPRQSVHADADRL